MDYVLHVEAKQKDDPASGVHLFAETVTGFLRELAEREGFELTITESFDVE